MTKLTVWSPLEMASDKSMDLPFESPPCGSCRFFRPTIVLDSKGEPTGTRFCHGEEMYRDFSCFRPLG